MNTVEVRPATAADAIGLAQVQTQSWREAYRGLMSEAFLARRTVSPDMWVGRLHGSGLRTSTMVAVSDCAVVGFISVGPELTGSEPDLGHLYAIYLLAGWWGRGVGHRLHRAGTDALAAAGFEAAMLWVLDTNERAIAFYQREGWRFDGHEQREEAGSELLLELRMSRAIPTDQLNGRSR